MARDRAFLIGSVAPGLAFDDDPREGGWLMDRDRARWEALEADPVAGGGASLLWYRFARPTITVGRLQDPERSLDRAALARDGVPVVVRPTGGRAVFHVDEWTYGAVVPADHPTLGGSLRASCAALVRLIASALREAYGLPVEVGTGAAVAGPRAAEAHPAEHPAGLAFACFARAYGHEATVHGRKLMGSAQRRGRRAYLQQGSLLVGAGHERLARYALGAAAGPSEAELAARTTTLESLLGEPPDPAPFHAALARGWLEVATPSCGSND